MGARTGVRALAVASVLGLAVTACSSDGDDDGAAEERDYPQTLSAACADVADILQPDDFEDGDGAIDYAYISTELNAFIENGEDEEIGATFQGLADAAEQQVALQEADEANAGAQETLFENPSDIPTEITELENGEQTTIDLGSGEDVDQATIDAANTAFQSALDSVDTACEAEGEPLVDPEEIASQNAELEEELQGGEGNEEFAPETTAPAESPTQG